MEMYINPYRNRIEDYPSTENCKISIPDDILICTNRTISKDTNDIKLEDKEYDVDFDKIIQVDKDATIGVVLDSETVIEPEVDGIKEFTINSLDTLNKDNIHNITLDELKKIYYTRLLEKIGYKHLMFNVLDFINDDKSNYTYCDGFKLILKPDEEVLLNITDIKYKTSKLYFDSLLVTNNVKTEGSIYGITIKNKEEYTICIYNLYLLFDGFEVLDPYQLYKYNMVNLVCPTDISRIINNLSNRIILTVKDINNTQIDSIKQELKSMYQDNIEERLKILESIAMFNLMELENSKVDSGDDLDD